MTIFLTILAGVATFVVGQIFLRLLVEPVHEMKRTIADIAVALIQHANICELLYINYPDEDKN